MVSSLDRSAVGGSRRDSNFGRRTGSSYRGGSSFGSRSTSGSSTESTSGSSSRLGTSSSVGTGTARSTLDPIARGHYETLLGRFSDQLIGSPIPQAQGDISEAGGGGLHDLLEDRARGLLTRGRDSDESRQYGADDITRRVNALASGRGRHGAPAHAGVLARELGQYNRDWESDQFGRDIQGLSAAGNVAGQAQALALDPMTRFASILQGFGALTQGRETEQRSDTRDEENRRYDELSRRRYNELSLSRSRSNERGGSRDLERGGSDVSYNEDRRRFLHQ